MNSLTDQQRIKLAEILKDDRRQTVTSAKWDIKFTDGRGAGYLTEQCHLRSEAFLACVERFGAKVKDII